MEDREGRESSLSRRPHVRHRYARGRRFAGVEGRITDEQHSSEYERPDRGRRIGLRREWRRGDAGAANRAEVGSSDRFVLPITPPKETRRAEGRGQPGRNPGEREKGRTQSRITFPSGLAGVNAGRPARPSRPGSPPFCITSTSKRSNGRFGVRSRRRVRESTGSRWRTTSGTWRTIFGTSAREFTGRYRPHPVRRVFIPNR